MTILGDKEQVASEETSTILDQLPEIFGEHIRIVTLNKSYRSPYEIGTFASQLIHQTDIEYVKRHGKTPVIERIHSHQISFRGVLPYRFFHTGKESNLP